MKVPLLDLKAQYKTIKKDLDSALLDVAESQYFILGPKVKEFEEEVAAYLKVKHSVGVSSGTDALLIALMAAGIGEGDEVIVPTYSFFATAGVVARLNAKPVLVDIDPVTYNIDPAEIEKRVTDRTKAVIPVHLYGQSADMKGIMSIAEKHNLTVIEDAAQAIGAQYEDGRCAGTIGDYGCFSFFPSKNLGGFGDGGLVVTNNDETAERLRTLRVHGGKPKYYHKMIGGNFRLDAIQAAVLKVKLPKLDSWSAKRRDNADLYSKLFIDKGLAQTEGVTEHDDQNRVLIPKPVYRESGHKNYHIYNQYVVRVEKRDELRSYLKEREIGNEVYYPVPFHRQECFTKLNCNDNDYGRSNISAGQSIALPIYPELTNEQIEYVVDTINEFFGG